MTTDFLFKSSARGSRARRSTSSGRVAHFRDLELDLELARLGVAFLAEDDDFLADFFLPLPIFGIGNAPPYNPYASAPAHACAAMSFVGQHELPRTYTSNRENACISNITFANAFFVELAAPAAMCDTVANVKSRTTHRVIFFAIACAPSSITHDTATSAMTSAWNLSVLPNIFLGRRRARRASECGTRAVRRGE